MKHDVDALLQQALSPSEEPAPWLNEKIMQIAKETEHMKKGRNRIPTGIAVAVLTLMAASLGVFAGWKYLAPQKVAEEFADELLAKAFETADAIQINETQEYAGYKITLLGIVSGKGLSEYTNWDEQGNIVEDRTYVVTAIENADGTPRPEVSDDAFGQDSFYVSPYIKGLSMGDYNAHTLGGGYSEDVVDGIQYRIMECDNIEMFAARGIYLGVSDGSFYNAEAYLMDDKTGEIRRNEAYTGLNALFELPIPAFKGDEAAVTEYLNEMETEEMPEDAQEIVDEIEKNLQTKAEEVSTWTLTDFKAGAECVYEKELAVDAKGEIHYSYRTERGNGSDATVLVEGLFTDDQPGSFRISGIYSSDGEGGTQTNVETFELLENGNVMLRVFVM